MDDDFGDFTGFNQDHSSSAVPSNPNSGSSSGVFPSKEGPGFLNMNSDLRIPNSSTGQNTTGAVNFTTFDANFNIPPPLSPPGANIHLAGGVPFDIPPLPDDGSFDSFSPAFEIENPLKFGDTNTHSTGGNETRVGGTVSHQSVVQPIADFGDFSSSAPVSSSSSKPASDSREDKAATRLASGQASTNNSEWTPDFGSFNIPPPIDMTESIESSAENNSLSNTTKSKLDASASEAVVSEFGGFETVAVEKNTAPVEANTETLGDFSAFSQTSNPQNFANFATGSDAVNTKTTTENISTTDDFTSFESSTAFTSASSDQKVENTTNPATTTIENFANFEIPSLPSDPTSIDNPSSSTGGKNEDNSFGDFSSSQAIPPFPTFENNSSTNKPTGRSSTKPSGDDFGAFSDAQTTSTDALSFPAFQTSGLPAKEGAGNSLNSRKGDFSSSSSEKVKDDDFGKFETSANSSSGNTGARSPPEDDFGDFSTSSNFATFDNTSQQTTNPPKDDFSTGQATSNFAAFGSSNSQKTASTAKDDFGDFSSGMSSSGAGDGFGDFTTSSGGNDGFGDFTSSSSGFAAFSSAGKAPTPVTTARQDPGKVLTSCFKSVGVSSAQTTPTSTLRSLLANKAQGDIDQSLWQSLQKCIDLAIPLYKWDRSSLQDNFYSALKVDPMLISKPSTLSVLTGQVKFEDPLGGTTAAEDLVESFGFEGGLEESRQRSVSPPPLVGGRKRLSHDRSTPTLLDLSLPETPGSPTGQNPFTLTEDLMGLDLNPQPQAQQLTSIQELLRNESLVVNKSNWVDPNLKEFGEGRKKKADSRPSTPQTAKKQNTVELQLQQLGLDANKVSSFTGGNRELSLAARTVLGRLPELSFMLKTDGVVQTNQYSL